ncbi:unnamed protein product [Sphagnum balticum]
MFEGIRGVGSGKSSFLSSKSPEQSGLGRIGASGKYEETPISNIPSNPGDGEYLKELSSISCGRAKVAQPRITDSPTRHYKRASATTNRFRDTSSTGRKTWPTSRSKCDCNFNSVEFSATTISIFLISKTRTGNSRDGEEFGKIDGVCTHPGGHLLRAHAAERSAVDDN